MGYSCLLETRQRRGPGKSALCVCALLVLNMAVAGSLIPMSQQTGLRKSFVAAFDADFELLGAELRIHEGATCWLATVRARRRGSFVFRIHFETPGYGYRYHDNELRVQVGERGCRRDLRVDLRPQQVCVGDSLIVPVLAGEWAINQRFSAISRFSTWPESAPAIELDTRKIHSGQSLSGLKYLGRSHSSAVFRGGDRAAQQFLASFEAVQPGAFNLQLSARLPAVLRSEATSEPAALEQSVVVVPADTPITVLLAHESVWQSDEDSAQPRSSSAGGTSYPVSLLQLRPGDRFSLRYGGLVVPLTSAQLQAVPAVEPDIRTAPYALDRAAGFTDWLPEAFPVSNQRRVPRAE